MPTNKKITFDKLDKKVIQQLPLMIDLIASTYNKIKLLFDHYYEYISEYLTKELKQKKWSISEKEIKNIFYPLTSIDYTSLTKIKTLENFFCFESYFDLYLGNQNKRQRSLGIYFGHKYEDFTYSSFVIWEWNRNTLTPLYPLKFYEKIKSSITEDFIEVWLEHPELGHKEEYIEIFCKDFDQDKINKTYEVFKNKVLIPYIKNLK